MNSSLEPQKNQRNAECDRTELGYADQLTLDPMYISTGDPRAAQQLESLHASFGKLPFFCINDTCDEASDVDLRLLRIGRTLNQLLPEPSSFEYA